MISKSDRTLIVLLALQDSIFAPLRREDWHNQKRKTNTYFARQKFKKSGLFWRSNQRSAADRVQAGRELKALESSGAIEIIRHGQRTVGVRLSDATDWRLRAQCGLPGLAATERVLTTLVACVAADDYADHGTEKIVRELDLAGLASYSGEDANVELVWQERELSPALCRGWAWTTGDIRGAAWYGLTTPGLDWLAKVHPKPLKIADDDEGFDFYFKCLNSAFSELGNSEPQDKNELGLLPVPVSFPTHRELKS